MVFASSADSNTLHGPRLFHYIGCFCSAILYCVYTEGKAKAAERYIRPRSLASGNTVMNLPQLTQHLPFSCCQDTVLYQLAYSKRRYCRQKQTRGFITI